MLSGLHLFLTYTCLYECDHCFLYCSPRAEGTFTLENVESALDQAVDAGVTSIYIEGGEPFLYYPLLLEALRAAKRRHLQAGLVTNCYWATSAADAVLWLRPIAEIGIDDLSVSDDAFHSDDVNQSPAKRAREAAEVLGIPLGTICIDGPTIQPAPHKADDGAVIGGDVLFKGRAADKLTNDLPKSPATTFDCCPHEELENPGRVHLDPFGDVFVCQGISIGNIWKKPLAQIMADYRPLDHPIVGPLVRGGPAQLARESGLPTDDSYVDHCHMCFLLRRQLLDRFGETLCPESVYGDIP